MVDAAKRWNAAPITIGSHGRRGIGRVLPGSGAEPIERPYWREPRMNTEVHCALVRLAGIEPTTLGFGGQYSIH